MPEGPELNKAAKLVNSVCNGKIFHGKIVKSIVNQKNPEIPHQFTEYMIHAESRGKEMALILSSAKKDKKQIKDCEKSVRILFRFGMSGRFQFTTTAEMHKHAHLSFFTKEKPVMVLSFVDVRRFGRWEVNDSWSNNRGPDPILEYSAFRDNVLNNLEDKDFEKPLCEVMHNQRYFNGIGNYLRAEIIFRAGIPPFTRARDVFAKLLVKKESEDSEISSNPDILQLCNIVPSEVLLLPGAGYDPSGDHSDYSAFRQWLQCYNNPDLNNLVDHDGRTIWFKGPVGPLVPKGGKKRHQKKRSAQDTQDSVTIKNEEEVKPKRKTIEKKREKSTHRAKAKPNKRVQGKPKRRVQGKTNKRNKKQPAAVPAKTVTRKRKVSVKDEAHKKSRIEDEIKTASLRKVRRLPSRRAKRSCPGN